MGKLLRAGFRRYIKSSVFYLALIVTSIIAVACGIQARTLYLDDVYIMAQFVTFAVMISWLVGREYDEGIFRNKVVSGHTKGSIFLSELIIGICACLIMFLIHAGIFIAFNSYVFSKIAFNVLARIFIGSLLVNVCFVSILVTISCIIPHRAIVAITNILLVMVLLLSTYSIESIIEQEEYYTEYEYEYEQVMDKDGNIYMEGTPIEGSEYQVKNPNYIGGPVREVFEVLYDVIPYGHMTEYLSLSNDWFGYNYYDSFPDSDMTWEESSKDFEVTKKDSQNINKNLIYSVVVLTVIVFVGFECFRKKELK